MNSLVFTYINSEDDERVFDIPYEYEDPTKIFVIHESAKENIRKKLSLAR